MIKLMFYSINGSAAETAYLLNCSKVCQSLYLVRLVFAIMCFCPSIVVMSNLWEQCIYFLFLPRFTNQCNSKLYFANSLQFEPHICFNDNFWWEIVLYLDCSTFVMPRNACQLLPPLCPPQACAKRNMKALPRTYQSFLSSNISTLPHNLNNAEQVEVQINLRFDHPLPFSGLRSPPFRSTRRKKM